MRFRFLAILAACLCLNAKAVTPTTDFSDLWFNPNEEGWGVTITQQNNVLFITMFVYGPNNQPRWYVGPSTTFLGASPTGVVTFTGPLYEATGPYFGAATYDENSVAVTPVGNVTFAAGAISNAGISYSVGATTVTKSIVRQTWRAENISGVYIGASLGNYTGCGGRDGYFESPAKITVNHDGFAAVTVLEEGNGYTCTYQGAYSQLGRMGEINGVGSCTSGGVQQFRATEVQGGIQGLTMRYGVTFSGACQGAGRMGGVRRAQ